MKAKILDRRLTLLLLVLLAGMPFNVYAQSGTWVWMKGSNKPNDTGYYGVKGVFSHLNEPPARMRAAYWTDLDGNLWLFGGEGVGGKKEPFFNDLWKYDISLNEWVWVDGPKYDDSLSGALKGPTYYYPWSRTGSAFWTDKKGDLWLYGGLGEDSLGSIRSDDFWKYNIISNKWTRVFSGTYLLKAPAFGKKRVPSVKNDPFCSSDYPSCWVNSDNSLWLFTNDTSSCYTINCRTTYNCLWRYDISSNTWTWMKGDTIAGSNGNRGLINIEDSTNLPSARDGTCSHWKDNNNNFYMFGGFDNSKTNIINFRLRNDVWKFNTATNNWTWVAGPDTLNSIGSYISKCVAGQGNYPAARQRYCSVQTVGCAQLLWLFGGMLNFRHDSVVLNQINDLWFFNPTTLLWTWVSGSAGYNDPGHYGIQGVTDPTNMIPAKSDMCSWSDKNNCLWVFGGSSYNYIGQTNDLWKYIPDTACVHAISVQIPNDTICPFQHVGISTKGLHNVTLVPNTWTNVKLDSFALTPSFTTTYKLYYDDTFKDCKNRGIAPFTIFVKPTPLSTFSITPQKVLTTATNVVINNITKYAGTETWQLNGNTFSHTIIDSSITLPAVAGKYAITLIVKSDSSGCIDTLTKWVQVIDTALLFVPTAFSPNGDGVNDVLYAIVPSANVKLKTFRIYNRWGQQVFETQSLDKGWDGTFNGKPEDVGTYVYYVEAESATNGKSLFTKGTVTLVR